MKQEVVKNCTDVRIKTVTQNQESEVDVELQLLFEL